MTSESSAYWDYIERENGYEPKAANPDQCRELTQSERKKVLTEVMTRLVNYEAQQIFNAKEYECFILLLEGDDVKAISRKTGLSQSRLSQILTKIGRMIKEKYDTHLEDMI